MENYLLTTHKLCKQYGNQKAVDNVSIHLNHGDIYGFIGRNGAGKTTFLKMISGLAMPTSGEITLFGRKGKDIAPLFSRIGVLIENPGLFPHMSAYENLKMKCICVGINKSNYAKNILDIVGLSDVGNKRIRNFSIGMKQRLGIGMALVGEPDLLLLDEPINGLDPQGIVEVRDTLLSLNTKRKITIVISSHILEELSKIATRYGIIDNGRLIKEMTKEELFAECSEKIEIKLLQPEKAIPIIRQLGHKSYKVVDHNTIYVFDKINDSGKIIMELSKRGIEMQSISIINQGIENYYLKLTGGNIS